ncbi:hypothetical protein BCV70DRAFT_200400 [Testicularia cyperi]|uniref:Mediator of RNA polymerase II transcription subunit 8 n=1 Tax=Testicularia cyperi TaxID=1882483 RepID=A0A317XPM6_9BASI|nr:hypothetical protein BCV70DRAFT_200400 [Testicularia cyperi]
MAAAIVTLNTRPALLHRYTNLLSHAYSLSSSLISASPHFLPSQLASFNKILEAEAKNANLYADEAEASTLFGGLGGRGTDRVGGNADQDVKASADGLPELSFYDAKSALPMLLAHPVLPIPEDKLNFLGALLRTAPEPDIQAVERELVERYDRGLQGHLDNRNPAGSSDELDSQLDRIQEECSQHDILALKALRTWYHIQQAPDEDGNVLNFKERLPKDGADGAAGKDEEDKDLDDAVPEGDEGDTDDKSTDEEEASLRAARREREHHRRMEEHTWSASSVSAFLHGHLSA